MLYASVVLPKNKGKCEEQAYTLQELESKLAEEATQSMDLGRQHKEEVERCRLMKVSSCMQAIGFM